MTDAARIKLAEAIQDYVSAAIAHSNATRAFEFRETPERLRLARNNLNAACAALGIELEEE